MAVRVVQAQADRDGLDPDEPEISTAGQPASRLQWALAPRADLLARLEAAGSNSVWEAPAQVSAPQVAVRPRQVSLRRAQQRLHGARLQERLQAASALPQQGPALARLSERQVDVPAPWQPPGLALEKPLAAPQAER
jgi:hypothetical protein